MGGWLQDLTYDWGRFIEYDMQLVFAIGAGSVDVMICNCRILLDINGNGVEKVEVDLGKVYDDCTMSRVTPHPL